VEFNNKTKSSNMSTAPNPSWPPPSGGAPVTTPEMGPILNPYLYGSVQGVNISTADPAPRNLATFFPQGMPPNNGQNQQQQLPAWPSDKFTMLPSKAPPELSQIP
jgi:hypothetical protein